MSSIPQGRTAAFFFGKAKLNTRYHGNSSFAQEHLVSYTEMLYKQQMSMRGPAAMVTLDGATNSKLHSRVDNYEAFVRFLSASLFCQFYGFVPRKALPSPEHYDVPDATPKVAIQTSAATLATFRSYPCDPTERRKRLFATQIRLAVGDTLRNRWLSGRKTEYFANHCQPPSLFALRISVFQSGAHPAVCVQRGASEVE